MIPIQGISTSKEIGRYQLLYVKGNVIHLRLIPDNRHIKYDLRTGLFLPSSSNVVFYFEEGYDQTICYSNDMPIHTNGKYKYQELVSQIVPNICATLCIALVNKQDDAHVEKIMREMLPNEDVIVDQHKSDGSYRFNVTHEVPDYFYDPDEILVKGQETVSYEEQISLEQLIRGAAKASQQHKNYSIHRG